jgi:hypothetical protein
LTAGRAGQLRGWLLRHRALFLAMALTAAVVGIRRLLPGGAPRFDRFDLPAFDPYVYVAMAENPRFFTVAPWGYRVLGPALAAVLPTPNVVKALTAVTLASLVAAGAVLFLFLRRLGHREAAALVAVLAFACTGPVGAALEAPFLGDPLALALAVGFLLAVEAQAPLAVLVLLAVLGALAKEVFVLFLPLVYLAHRPRHGRPRAVAAALLVGLPAVLASVLLRAWWTPHIDMPSPSLDVDLVRRAWQRFRVAWPVTWPGALLGGILPLALLGAVRPAARAYLARYGYLAAALLALPFVAWINIPGARAVPLFGGNAVRLLLYALPLLLPLALVALDRVWPNLGERPPPWRAPRWLPGAAVVAAAAVALSPLFLDRYRRVALHQVRDGPLVLATCRQSLATAARIEKGEVATFEPARQQFVWHVSDIHGLNRMRWYLKGGWGPAPHYGTGDVVMRDARAHVLLPCLRPRPLELVLSADASREGLVDVLVNDQPVGQAWLGPGSTPAVLRVPAAALFRGDNVLTLAAPPAANVRLRALGIARLDRQGVSAPGAK